MTERIYAGSVEVPMNTIARSVIALAVATSWTPFNSWAQQSETELLKQARGTKHQDKKIALARVKRGAIKAVELEKENGVLIWSVDVAQPTKRDLTAAWRQPTPHKLTAATEQLHH